MLAASVLSVHVSPSLAPQAEIVSPAEQPVLQGKTMAMTTFSAYPADPCPRRAVDALLEAGMRVDLVCLREPNQSAREHAARQIAYVFSHPAEVGEIVRRGPEVLWLKLFK